jgi:hypothetical protein
MYNRQEPSPRLLREHIQQMDETLTLIDVLLNRTPYEPGAGWVTALPLDDNKAAAARASLKDASERASFVKVYAAHIQSVLDARKTVPYCTRSGIEWLRLGSRSPRQHPSELDG